MSTSQPILIAGPTASGKSALALALAEALGGTVINADSVQVYRELNILSARPTPSDMARVPHMLYGFVPAAEAYSAGRFVIDAARAIADVRASGRRPIIAGGTGLYFKALLEGLSPVPPVPPDIRAHWRREGERQSAGDLYLHLTLRDPEMAASLHPTDRQRIVRALEVFEATGTSLAEWRRTQGTAVVGPAEAVKLVVLPERAVLNARAGQRFEAMMQAGALGEARALGALGLDANLPSMRALGVAPLIAAVRGGVSLDGAVRQAKAETRQYIKRQETWLKRHMITWERITEQETESITAKALAFIQS